MKFLSVTFHIQWSTVTLLLSYLSQGTGSGAGEGAGTQVGIGGGDSNALVVGMSGLTFDMLVNDANDVAGISQLCEAGNSLSLAALEDTLRESRVRAGNNSDFIAVHYSNAVVIMSNCVALEDAKQVVLESLEMGYYEILKCLVHCPIWEDEGQKHWFWAKIHGTPAFEKTVWGQHQFNWDELWKKTMREDDVECYGEIRGASFIDKLPEKKLREYIIRLDAINILNRFHPELTREIAMDVELVVKHGPKRIIELIMETVYDLHPFTSHIAPHTVKSIKALQYLFFFDYNQIPRGCLKIENHQLAIQDKYVKWLIKNGCLPLLKDLCQWNTDLEFIQRVVNQTFFVGSVDALKWLHETGKMAFPAKDLVCTAVDHGHLRAVEWLVAKFRFQVDWTSVVKSVKPDLFSFECIRYIRDHIGVIMPDDYCPMFLAAEGNLDGLQAVLNGAAGPWKRLAKVAAITGQVNVLKWVHATSKTIPSFDSVEMACKMGHHSVLVWMFEVARTQIVPFHENGKISALGCILYAAMNNQQEAMEWILGHPLDGVLPSMKEVMRLHDEDISDETRMVVFDWIASKTEAIEPTAMLCVAELGHLQRFRELCEKGQPVTARVAEQAAFYCKINILEAIYEIDPSLVCKWGILELIEIGEGSLWKSTALNWLRKKCLLLSRHEK